MPMKERRWVLRPHRDGFTGLEADPLRHLAIQREVESLRPIKQGGVVAPIIRRVMLRLVMREHVVTQRAEDGRAVRLDRRQEQAPGCDYLLLRMNVGGASET